MTPDQAGPAGRLYDLVVVGAGPAGLAAAAAAQECGLTYAVLERGRLAQTVLDYPLEKPLHSPCFDVELSWGELISPERLIPTREDVLAHYAEFAKRRGLHIHSGKNVSSLEKTDRGIRVRSSGGDYEAKSVILATGTFGVQRRLNVPGETPERVAYRFVEGKPYAGRSVLVVGGGNSAAEAAIYLEEAGAKVAMSLRRPSFAPMGRVEDIFAAVRSFNRARLESLAGSGRLKVYFSSRVAEVTKEAALLQLEGKMGVTAVACERIFALLGADPDLSLLRQIGAAIGPDGRPLYNPASYETTIPGLYVAGHLTRELHMPNAIRITPRIVRRIAGRTPEPRGAAFAAEVLSRAAKRMRAESALARKLIRQSSLLRGAVQWVEAANARRDRRAHAKSLRKRYPRFLRRAAQALLKKIYFQRTGLNHEK